METVSVPPICASRAGQARSMSIRSTEVVWVYAVTTGIDPAKLTGVTGVAGEPVRLVTERGLSAVVGSVSDSPFGESTLPSLLADLSAIEKAGRAHHRVISQVAGSGPVLPLRLATVYADDETIARPDHAEFSPWTMLEACAEEISAKLSRIAVATRRRPSPLPSLADDSGWVVLSSAYLVDAEHASRFSEIAASITAAHTALRAVVTGPWPPYSFADR
jgi:hypothetical protein